MYIVEKLLTLSNYGSALYITDNQGNRKPELFDTYEAAQNALHEIFYDQVIHYTNGDIFEIDNPINYRISEV